MNLKRILPTFILVIAVFGFFFPGAVNGEVFTVTTTQDGGEGSLRAAIDAANANLEDDLIHLPPGTYTLTGVVGGEIEDANHNGDLDINTSGRITIVGAGSGKTIIDGGLIDRVIHVMAGTVVISSVTIQNGKLNCSVDYNAPNPSNAIVEHGGGIFNAGTLTLRNCTVQNNAAKDGCWDYLANTVSDGGHGGGIYNDGTLTIQNCVITGNRSGKAGSTGYSGKVSGSGGGIYNKGWLYMYDTTISDNKAAAGAESRPGGDGGHGGGIYSTSLIVAHRCIVSGNSSGNAGMGLHSHGPGKGGDGGGVYCEGTATFLYCAFRNNTAGNGSTDDNDAGDGGDGGGIYNKSMLSVWYCEVSGNKTGHSPVNVGTVGDGGSGAGIYNSRSGSISLIATTVSGNRAGDARSGTENIGHGGDGGGLYNASSASFDIDDCTIARNFTGFGGDNASGGNGGGIYSDPSGTLSIKNTIVADNYLGTGGQGVDIFGGVLSEGYNLIESTTGVTISGETTGNITGQDPKLDILRDYGGPTYCHSLIGGSPAIDAGKAERDIDQRGRKRPDDINGYANVVDGSDIGAVEICSLSLPVFSFNKNELFFGAAQGIIPASQSIIVTNEGDGRLTWSLSANKEWVHFTPAAGTGYSEVKVSVNPSGLAPGTYTAELATYSTNGNNYPQSVAITMVIYPSNSLSGPFGQFDTPGDGSTVRSSIPVTGWVVDDIGVEKVEIYREENGQLVYIDDAVLVEGARPDIEQAFPYYPGSNKAGWGYMMLTNGLPGNGNGTYVIHAIAIDKEGNTANLGSKTIYCDNANAIKPFGAIDTPKQGGAVNGSDFINYGWAITPRPNTIPADGSTIDVYIDGVKQGNVVYSQTRQDIANFFPGYNNSDAAGGYFVFDTTKLENGVHTIAWNVSDDAGNTDGVGSRFFTVYNDNISNGYANRSEENTRSTRGLDVQPGKKSLLRGAVTVKRGFSSDEIAEPVHPSQNGAMDIRIRELQRVELDIDGLLESGTVTGGYLAVGNEKRKLPIGSTLDCRNGRFYWQPGPGFIGNYRIVFIMNTPSGAKEKAVTITILPKEYNKIDW